MRILFGLLVLLSTSWALYESDAGKIDWHDALIGIPRTEASTIAPRFQVSSGGSLVVTVSKSNVLAAIHPLNGAIVWRQSLDPKDVVGAYESDLNRVVTLSSPGGSYLRSYELKTGNLVFESCLQRLESGRLLEPHGLGQGLAFSTDKISDVFALTNGYTIRRVDGLTGITKWTWTSEDQGSSAMFTTIIATEEALYAVGVTKSFASLTVVVTSLDPQTGTLISTKHVPSKISSPSDILVLKSFDDSLPVLTWLDNGVYALVLTPEFTSTSKQVSKKPYMEISDMNIGKIGTFVGKKDDGSADVFRISSSTIALEAVGEFTSSDHVPPTYAGGSDKDGIVFVSRVHWSDTLKLASCEVLAINSTRDKGVMTAFTFAYDPQSHGNIIHHAIETIVPKSMDFVSRILLTTSTGTLQLWFQDQLHWNREESLSKIVNVEFIDLPEQKSAETVLNGQGFLSRLARQVHETKGFPKYIAQFGRRFLMGPKASSVSARKKQSDPLYRDAFGFRKLIVVSTITGKVFGIDSANGNVVWNRLLHVPSTVAAVVPFKLFVVSSVTDGKLPEVVLLADVQHSLDLREVVAYHFEALTGNDLQGVEPKTLTGEVLFHGSAIDAYSTRHGEKRSITIIDENHKVFVYPKKPTMENMVSSMYFSTESAHHELRGYQLLPTSNGTDHLVAERWVVSFDPSERIQFIYKHSREPIASFGKVLGDRRTLYKYLNPHLMLVLTENLSVSQCTLYLVDGIKGTVVYETVLPATAGSCDVHATLTENWLVYHYYDEVSPDSIGFKVVSVELYEGDSIDDKTQSSDSTSYLRGNINLHAYTQSYLYPFGVTAIATTTTKFGITSKDVLGKIQTIPRLFLNPRRPKGKPTAEEQEEWLIQYDPLLPYDPRRVISHNYEVAGIHNIVTSPALLESTSIVFAYGLDLFLSRVAPSKTFDILSESFNKIQLIFTIIALALGVTITKPIVRRKQLRQQWYYS
ncbi:hypothetical protein Clacol_003543 [Clathrus columnatus]|uniref:ER membrane protein complex subunit 1 n=1 Tax=Clathrus columnatus TaxID=1419009 RepID=A0AAV5A9V8_9AGAM|nr:hypothetical protein Clacol_003543 [Clathrus columnatus]